MRICSLEFEVVQAAEFEKHLQMVVKEQDIPVEGMWTIPRPL